MLQIGIAVVLEEGRVLTGIRGQEGPLPGYAEFPGGKCLDGEVPAAAAVRECFEETGLEVTAEQEILVTQHEYPHGLLELHFWLCRRNDGREPAIPFRFVDWTVASRLTFPPANEPVLDWLRPKLFAADGGSE